MGDGQDRRRLSFIAEWCQKDVGFKSLYNLIYSPTDGVLEVHETKVRKIFLRRTKMPELGIRDFFIGSKIIVFGRQFDIIDYGDKVTKDFLENLRSRTFILLKSYVLDRMGIIIDRFVGCGVLVSDAAMVKFSPDGALKFLGEEKKGDVSMTVLMHELVKGPTLGCCLIGENIMEKVRACQKPDPSYHDIPPALQELFSDEEIRNGIYCSESAADVDREIDFFFSARVGISFTASFNNTTLAIIKPHAIKEGKHGKILTEILRNGFKVIALKTMRLARVNCEEFYEVYRGILPEYIQMVGQLASGICMAIEIGMVDENKTSYKEFRDFCGPMEPAVAKLLRPNSLRAKFGESKVLNAIHCTDLPGDAALELQYLFKIVSS